MTSVDVLVIGAGIAGASVAAELASGCSVLLLEAEQAAGVHSTGRSAALYLPSYGGPVVRTLTAASKPLFDEWSERVGSAILTPRRLLWLGTDEPSADAVRGMSNDNPLLEVIDAGQAVALCPTLRADTVTTSAVDHDGADIDVAALHQAYLAEFRHRGGITHYSASVDQIRPDGAGWQVRAEGTTHHASLIVNAAGAWADLVARKAGVPRVGLQPRLRSVFLSPPTGSPDMSGWPAVSDPLDRWYLRPESTLVLGSPADETAVEPCDARPDELEIARAIEAINAVTMLGLRSVTHSWAGLRTFAADRSPVIGAWPSHPGFHFIAGQGGYGIQMAPALAKLTADVVLHGGATDAAARLGIAIDDIAPTRFQSAESSPGIT